VFLLLFGSCSRVIRYNAHMHPTGAWSKSAPARNAPDVSPHSSKTLSCQCPDSPLLGKRLGLEPLEMNPADPPVNTFGERLGYRDGGRLWLTLLETFGTLPVTTLLPFLLQAGGVMRKPYNIPTVSLSFGNSWCFQIPDGLSGWGVMRTRRQI
jgi:hypothetical protein